MIKQTEKHIGRVILTHGRSLHSHVAAHSLGRRGVEVIGCDSSPLMTLSFSKYVKQTFLSPTEEEGPEKFLDVLEQQIHELRPEDDRPYVLMPMDRHTKLIAEHRERFEPLIKVTTPDIEHIRKVDPKNNLVRTARELDVPIPQTWILHDKEDLERMIPELPFPCFLKLPDGTGGVGVAKANDADQLRQHFADFQNQFSIGPKRELLIQDAVGDEDYCLTVLMQHGKIRAHMTYRNLQTFPADNGFGVLRETIQGDKLVAIAEKLLGAIGWHGVAELDFRWDGQESTPAHLIEINPRFWGGLFQSVESGIDYPWLLYQLTAYDKLDPVPEPVIGTRTRIPMVSILAELQNLSESDDQFARISSSLQHGWQDIKSGDFWSGLMSVVDGVSELLNPIDRLKQVRRWLQENQNTQTEIFSTDDPKASLGALYILGSLIRTGKLPAEIRRGEDSSLLENPYN